MTIADLTRKKSAAGGVTNYTFPFRILAETDITVYVVSALGVVSLKVLTTDYTVTFVSGVEGGEVVFNVATVAGETVWIYRDTPDDQGIDYERNKNIPNDSLELAQDKLTMLIQQALEELSRVPMLPRETLETSIELAEGVDLAPLRWDGTNQIVSSDPIQFSEDGIKLTAGGVFEFPDGTSMSTAAAVSTGQSSTGDLNFASDTDVSGAGDMFFSTSGVNRIHAFANQNRLEFLGNGFEFYRDVSGNFNLGAKESKHTFYRNYLNKSLYFGATAGLTGGAFSIDNSGDEYQTINARDSSILSLSGGLALQKNTLAPVIASGLLDLTGAADKSSHLELRAETGTTDDLTDISTSVAGYLLFLTPDNGDTITIKHNTAKIILAGAVDVVLNSTEQVICLFGVSTTKFVELFRSVNI